MVGHTSGWRAEAGTLAARLADARRRAFVGRAGEVDLFRTALSEAPPPFAVLYLHGPGGIGKSTLLGRFADEAVEAGWTPALLDCKDAGHPAAFLPAVSEALGMQEGADPLLALRGASRVVLLLDTYEAVPGFDDWLREAFLPALPEGALVVVAARDPPAAAWRVDPSWHELMRVVALRNLAPDDARALLRKRGVPEAMHDRVLGLTTGHPLALTLVADVVAQSGSVPETHEQAPGVIASLVERFSSEAPSPLHREALQICAHVRFTTESLLRAVLPDADATALFEWLRSLSFVEQSPVGVYPHDLARDAIDLDLRWRDERGYADLHRRIRTYVVERLRATTGGEQERLMRELQYLHRSNPHFRPFLSWKDTSAVTVRTLDAADVAQIHTLTERFEGADSAAIAAFWAERQPDAFLVFERSGESGISGFATALDLVEPSEDELAADPVVGSVFRWLRERAPLRAGERVFVGRYFVFEQAYGKPCPELDVAQLRSTLRWLNQPDLAWTFLTLPAELAPFWEPEFNYLDLPRAVGAEATVGDRTWFAYGRDWRASPVDAWLALMGERELTDDVAPEHFAEERPPALLVLSQPEFADAVRLALREATDPAALRRNPLVRSRLVADVADGVDPGEALTDLLTEAVDEVRNSEQGDKLHRALATTFFKGAPTQEAAAERLGLPFSTYRRHLAAGIQRVTGWLWDRELHGPDGRS